MSEPLKIGILGAAKIAERMVLPALDQNPNFELVAVASREISKARSLTDKYGGQALADYQQLLDLDIDAVYIPLPTGLHHYWALKALEQGVHVLLEKSAGCSQQEVQEIVEAARSRKRLVMENFQFQYHSQHQFAKQLLEEGAIGEVRNFRSAFGFPPFPDQDNIRYSKALGGGALLDAGAYTIKATTFMLGAGFEVSSASLHYPGSSEVDIFGAGLLMNQYGLCSQIAFGFDQFYQCNYEIWGSKGKLTSHRAFTAGPQVKPKITLERQNDSEEFELDGDNHFINLHNAFYDRIQKRDFEAEHEALLTQAQLIQQFKNLANGK